MTDETPQPEGEPSPNPEETAAAETKPFTYDDAVAQTGADDVVEPATEATQATPAEPAEPTAPTAPAAPVGVTVPPVPPTPPTPAPAAAEPAPARPPGIFVPKWVGLVGAAVVAALVFGGIGYAIGDSSDSSSTPSASNVFPGNANRGRQFPGNGQFPPGANLPDGGGQFPRGSGGSGGGTTASDAGFLGVGVQTSTDPKGVEVTAVADGSPAAKAGLQQGDVITAIDGDDVTSADAVRSAVQAKSSGDEISVTYTRNGQSSTVKATLTSRSQAQSS